MLSIGDIYDSSSSESSFSMDDEGEKKLVYDQQSSHTPFANDQSNPVQHIMESKNNEENEEVNTKYDYNDESSEPQDIDDEPQDIDDDNDHDQNDSISISSGSPPNVQFPPPLAHRLGLNAQKLHMMSSGFMAADEESNLPYRSRMSYYDDDFSDSHDDAYYGNEFSNEDVSSSEMKYVTHIDNNETPDHHVNNSLPRGHELGPLETTQIKSHPEPLKIGNRMLSPGICRVGWGPGGILVHTVGRSRTVIQLVKMSFATPGYPSSENKMPINIDRQKEKERYKSYIESSLHVHFDHYKSMEDEKKKDRVLAPDILTQLCNKYIASLDKIILDSEVISPPLQQHFHFLNSLWELAKTLWSNQQGSKARGYTSLYAEPYVRCLAVSKWLEKTVQQEVQEELSQELVDGSPRDKSRRTIGQVILTCLTGNQIAKACDFAVKVRDLRLAVLMASAGEDVKSQQCLVEQLTQWQSNGIMDFIDHHHQSIYQLLSGQTNIRTEKCLSWLRRLGLELWFSGSIQNADLREILDRYDNAVYARHSVFPAPPYASQTPLPHGFPMNQDGQLDGEGLFSSGIDLDMRYGLLRLAANPVMKLSYVLSPRTITADSLNHILPWHLHDLLRHSNVTSQLPRQKDLSMNYVMQLEMCGMWEWGIYIIQTEEMIPSSSSSSSSSTTTTIPPATATATAAATTPLVSDFTSGLGMKGNNKEKKSWLTSNRQKNIIQEILHRNIFELVVNDPDLDKDELDMINASFELCIPFKNPKRHVSQEEKQAIARTKKKEQFLLQDLQIPSKWIAQAKAIAYRYLRKPHSEFRFLIEAEQWNDAHQLMMRDILKTRILIEQQYTVLRKDLLMLEQHNSEIQYWERNGATILRYVEIFLKIIKIRNVKSQLQALMTEAHASGKINFQKKAQLERESQDLGVEMELSLDKAMVIAKNERLVIQLQTLKCDVKMLDPWPSNFVHDQIVDNVVYKEMISLLDTTIASFKKNNLTNGDLLQKTRSPINYMPMQKDSGMTPNPMSWDPHHRLRALTWSTIHRLQENSDPQA